MCNLYTLATTHESVRQLFKVSHSDIEDWNSKQSIYPDQLAPVVTQDTDDTRAQLVGIDRFRLPNCSRRRTRARRSTAVAGDERLIVNTRQPGGSRTGKQVFAFE